VRGRRVERFKQILISARQLECGCANALYEPDAEIPQRFHGVAAKLKPMIEVRQSLSFAIGGFTTRVANGQRMEG
jgi:hypothetical protein